MLPDTDAAIQAIAEAIARREGYGTVAARDAAIFIRATCARAPGYLRPPLRMATWLFDAWGCLRHGRPFHAQAPAGRIAQLESWESSRLGPARMLMTFYISLSVFALHEKDGAG